MAGRVHGHGRWRSRELERSGRSDLQVDRLEKEAGRWRGRPWWLAGGAEESKTAASQRGYVGSVREYSRIITSRVSFGNDDQLAAGGGS